MSLSKGLPGKGIGCTAAAAKEFFRAQIKIRPAMSIVVEDPRISLIKTYWIHLKYVRL
jgi:hypothetical protein